MDGARRRSFAEATAWVDAHTTPLPSEEVPLAALAGRVLTAEIRAVEDEPDRDRTLIDGLALRADETLGASAYNPVPFQLFAAKDALPPNGAARVLAGDTLPRGADAVVPLDFVHFETPGRCEAIEPVAAGHEVEQAGAQFRRGTRLLGAGRCLTAADIGLLSLAGIEQAAVMRLPRVVLISSARGATEPLASSALLLRHLIERDGGVASAPREAGGERTALAAALDAEDADIVLVIGGAGQDADNPARLALSDIGEIAIGEVALHPGGVSAMGRTRRGRCVFLLQGAPGACLWTYELLAGRAVRRLAGRDADLPFPARPMTTASKIVSAIGMTEIFPVRFVDENRVEPIVAAGRDTLLAAAQADGFVVVPEAREGIPAGADVTVWLLAGRYR